MAEALKDQFAEGVVEVLGEHVARHCDVFDRDLFGERLLRAFPELELKDRINLVADTLRELIGGDFESALEIICAVAVDGVEGFDAWPLASFVERHGVHSPQASLEAMATITKQFSCEFAVRPFIEHHTELTFQFLETWAHDDHEAVRRLPSEGTRPLLPWGPRVQVLTEHPERAIELLTILRHDPSETVRRSVANHLNDVAKFDADLVVDVLKDWTTSSSDIDDAMVRHGLRTLVKQGHPGAMELLGFTLHPLIEVVSFTCDPGSMTLGSDLELRANIVSTGELDQRLVVDFVIHHIKASGQASAKVFKWKNLDLGARENVTLTKKRRIATASTRRYHAGYHRVELLISGQRAAEAGFELEESS